MKKSFFLALFCLLVPVTTISADSYGILVNEAKYYAGTLNPNPMDPAFQEYQCLAIPLKKGDFLQLFDLVNKAAWTVKLDTYSVEGVALQDGKYICSADGCYDFYIKIQYENDQLYIGKSASQDCQDWGDSDYRNKYGSAVPPQCPDVMMQGFYFNSYEVKDTTGVKENPDKFENGTNFYGDTRWKTLYAQSGEIGAYFDLIWLPPSAMASGTGYHPRQYSNQNSDWGTRAELQQLIASFHNSGTKVVADMVLNHGEAMASWCDFAHLNFGEYGEFQPDGSFICKGDEMNDPATNTEELAGPCWGTATGPNDDGTNYAAARDWAHDNENVREMFRAYAQWMRNVIGYDGFRYDECKGYHMSHVNDYNTAANAYISFMELWDGNDRIWQGIKDASNNTMALDFQTKYSTFDAIGRFDYSKCFLNGGNGGLIGSGRSKYAITFVDSHDWFYRGNNQEFGCSSGNCYDGISMSEDMKDRLLQAIAYQLSMPGVPCVFYPHWNKYKAAIKDMINARHVAGVHSESPVGEEEGGGSGYKATITGKNGKLILMLGDKTVHEPTGANEWLATYNYKLMAFGPGYAMWVLAENDYAPRLIVTPETYFDDLTAGIDVTVQPVGGSSDTKTVYYTTDGSDPTTASASFTGDKTFNFKQTTTLKVMAACGTAQSKIQTYTYTYREPLKRGIQVHFNKPAEWEKVYFYAWIPGTDEQGNPTSVNMMGAYPGQRIYQDADGWYSYEFDLAFDSVNFCISSGNECGLLNVRSNDLVADYDTWYGWEEGFETESNYEKKLDGKIDLNPAFDLVISPESGNFRDLQQGEDVTITVVGKTGAMIYYSINGVEQEPVENTVSFKINNTATVSAYAYDVNTKEKTETYTAVYTYKAPQQGVITVKFAKPSDWEDLYLYAFTRVKVGTKYADTPYALVQGQSAKWPGTHWTSIDHSIAGDSTYTWTMREEVQDKDLYIIFNIGSNVRQSQDIYLTENTCYVWNPSCWQAVVDENCDGLADAVESVENDTDYRLDPTQPMYNILGVQVDADYKGIVIQNGHKYLLK